MAVIPLETALDPRVADYAAVADPELAEARGVFVAEGRFVVRRLIEGRQYRVRSVLVTDAARTELADVLDRLEPEIPIYVGPAASFREITGFNIHRGCLALAERPPAADARDLPGMLEGPRLVLLLESVANADNVGGIFRNAAAFGAGAVLLDAATCDPLYRKAIRTSMGASLGVAFARLEWPAGLDLVRAAGLAVAALTLREPAEPLDRFAAAHRGDRLAILLGHEGNGLSEAAAAAADYRVRIPMAPGVDSLNVAVAAGIALSRLTPLADVW